MAVIAADSEDLRRTAECIACAARAVSDLEGHLAALGLHLGGFDGPATLVAEALGRLVTVWAGVATATGDDLTRLHDAVLAVADVWERVERSVPGGGGS